MSKEQHRITGKRVTFMHAKLWEAAKYAQLEAGARNGRHAEYGHMHALIDAAFVVEAYLQFIGAKKYRDWKSVERKSFRKRLEAVAEVIGLTPDFGAPPYSTVLELMRARNGIAHARPQYSNIENVVTGCYKEALAGDQGAPIEILCTKNQVEKHLDAVEQVVEEMHIASKEPLHPLYVQGVTSAVIHRHSGEGGV